MWSVIAILAFGALSNLVNLRHGRMPVKSLAESAVALILGVALVCWGLVVLL